MNYFWSEVWKWVARIFLLMEDFLVSSIPFNLLSWRKFRSIFCSKFSSHCFRMDNPTEMKMQKDCKPILIIQILMISDYIICWFKMPTFDKYLMNFVYQQIHNYICTHIHMNLLKHEFIFNKLGLKTHEDGS